MSRLVFCTLADGFNPVIKPMVSVFISSEPAYERVEETGEHEKFCVDSRWFFFIYVLGVARFGSYMHLVLLACPEE